jgi:hypothetical protein
MRAPPSMVRPGGAVISRKFTMMRMANDSGPGWCSTRATHGFRLATSCGWHPCRPGGRRERPAQARSVSGFPPFGRAECSDDGGLVFMEIAPFTIA